MLYEVTTKPIVGNLTDCRKIEQLVKDGAVILGSSSVRYAEEIQDFLKIPEEERGKIVTVFGTSGLDEFNYAIHVVEAIGGLIGTGAVSTRYAGRGEVNGQACETFLIKYRITSYNVCYTKLLRLYKSADMIT